MALMRDGTSYDSARGPLNWFLLGIARNLVRQRLGRERFYASLADESKSPNERVRFACIGVKGKGESDSGDAGRLGDVLE